ncbi:hypothetical protein THYS13_07330 [Thermoanaerobacter sp. YS13]|uniref:hypothetical protein n=1 Tax=Thermoanaerobacter sp. YS13 TaxID=1511746 RepID=UPI000573D69D|nr:hypothetical protein [Thermoanaerobacter sp. YS13]KHO62670.1 hypothetical protein THYS13_07330 [Thermoanaerobacter sp. YS13]
MKIGYSGAEQDIPRPKQISIVDKEIAKADRTASGKLVKDIIAIKKEIQLKYDGLTPTSFNLFRTYFEAGKPINFIYDEAGQTKTIQCYITEMPRQVFIHNTNYVSDITITLEEV